jgi:hypothetical protein
MHKLRSQAPRNTTPRITPVAPTASQHDSPPPPHRPDFDVAGPVPFLSLRGRWLAQMGFGVGAQVRVEACGTKLTLEAIGNATDIKACVPTTLEREVHYTEVEPYTHHPHSPWSDQ